ncbi:hypothetical protein N6G95_04595 [Pediococcus inopinatus]|nr:hypothetical protein [Pediococcus inopinatus]WPC20469.1 hypothetical protein N6G95_04595 [Pediococcus inopinatus]
MRKNKSERNKSLSNEYISEVEAGSHPAASYCGRTLPQESTTTEA